MSTPQQQQNPQETIRILAAKEQAADGFIGNTITDLINTQANVILLQQALQQALQQLAALQAKQPEGQPSQPANSKQPQPGVNPDELSKWRKKAEAEERERQAVEQANAKLRETVKELRADNDALKVENESLLQQNTALRETCAKLEANQKKPRKKK